MSVTKPHSFFKPLKNIYENVSKGGHFQTMVIAAVHVLREPHHKLSELIAPFSLKNQQGNLSFARKMHSKGSLSYFNDTHLPKGPIATVKFPPRVRLPPFAKASTALSWLRMITRSDT